MSRFAPLLVLALVALTPVARAAPQLRIGASTEQAEVGEGIRIQLSAMSDGDEPGSPRLRAPAGFTVQGPNVSSSQSFSLTNGHFQHQHGITATWLVVATHPGRYVIGPAAVQFGAKTVQSDTVTVEIVAQGTMPKRPRHNPFDPFDSDPFFSQMPKLPGLRGIPGMPDLDELENQLHQLTPEVPEEYKAEHAPDQTAFLRATVTPTDAVVGQQVTLNIYSYAGNGPYEAVQIDEPSVPDFLSHTIIDGPYRQPNYFVEIDGQRYITMKVREIALFPLRAGDLVIGPMKMGFHGRGYPDNGSAQGLVRASKELRVTVREPPVQGRPPGYELGNVGAYTLSSEVEPRSVEAGDAVAVTVRLEGTGNVPRALKLPEQNGVDWLDPTINDQVEPRDGLVQGSRTFRYVVHLDKAGTLDLGDVTLPYYDPKARRYQVARTSLGTVEVKPGKAPLAPAAPSSSAQPEGPLEDIGNPRRTLGAPAAAPRHLTDSTGFFAFLAGGPLAVLALGGLAELTGRLRRKMAARSQSLSAASRKALADARDAAARGDGAAVAGAVERAVYTAIEDRLGLKARAVLRADLVKKLEGAGAAPAVATELVTLLDACDQLRFSASDAALSGATVERASAAIAGLPRATKKASTEQAA